jgi:Kef-type K+ transport system membrane component KefB
MQWRRRRGWHLGLLGVTATASVIAAAMALGAAGEGDWARWRTAFAILSAGSFAMVLLVYRHVHRRRSGELVTAGIVALTGLVVVVLALMFAAGSAFVGDWNAAAGALPVAAVAALATAAAALRARGTRAQVLPPFKRLTPEAFIEDVDPPAYPAPHPGETATDANGEGRRPPTLLQRLLRALTIRR